MKFRAALANNDWMVDYGDVIIISEEKVAQSMGFRSTLSMAGDKQNQKLVEALMVRLCYDWLVGRWQGTRGNGITRR